MNSLHAFKSCLAAAIMVCCANFGSVSVASAQLELTGAEDVVEVLTRGPVHEAFAETVTFDPQLGIVVPKAPSEAIEELPPDQRPEGANIAWIPGYWAWDDERNDFLWISGIWRALPPDRQWLPGYWGASGQGFQWTSGYWADANVSEVEYLPEPPASVEIGPNIAAPSVDYVWVPGCWVWLQNRYAWRPGNWAMGYSDWAWVPAHYVWTPRGYVFVDGYNDYSVARRGVLFAPVYFNRSVYAQRGFTFTPAMAISLAVFGNQLFLRPNYSHYYFGDYYGSSYSRGGFYPWFSFNSGGFGYDPFYAQQRWQNRQNTGWEQSVQADFQHRVDRESARPPRTLAAQQALVQSGNVSNVNNIVVATSLVQLANSKDSSMRFQPVNVEERQKLAQRGKEVQKFRQERQQLETKPVITSGTRPDRQPEPVRIKHSKSPFVAKPADQLGEIQAPPKRSEVLKPDLLIDPKPRVRAEATPGSKIGGQLPKGKPDQRKVEPKSPKVTPDQPKVKPDQTNIDPNSPKIEPKQPKAKPNRAKVKPDQPKVDPNPPVIEPTKQSKAKPDQPKVKPDQPRVDPNPPKIEPKQRRVKPDLPNVNPERPKEPRPPTIDPKPPKVDPTPRSEPKPPKFEPKPPTNDPKPPKVALKPPKLDPKPPRSEPKPPKLEPKPPTNDPTPPRVAPKPPKLDPQPPRNEPKPPKVDPKPPKVKPD